MERVTEFTVDPSRQTESHWQVKTPSILSVLLTTSFFSIHCVLVDRW